MSVMGGYYCDELMDRLRENIRSDGIILHELTTSVMRHSKRVSAKPGRRFLNSCILILWSKADAS